jgi:Mg2+ and Co2+ transporter CorA
VIVDRAIYRDGQRVAEPRDLADMAAVCRDGGGIAWIGLYRPTEEEFAEVALVPMLEQLMVAQNVDDEERRYLRDVHDHSLRLEDQVDGFRDLLQNILSVNLTLETKALNEASNAQNEEEVDLRRYAPTADPIKRPTP